jgi:hypothetical protein
MQQFQSLKLYQEPVLLTRDSLNRIMDFLSESTALSGCDRALALLLLGLPLL